jgi:hypothetical protein
MKRPLHIQVLSLFFLFLLHAFPVSSQIDLDVETGSTFTGYNDVRIPGNTGTSFSLSEELKADPSLFLRIRLTWNINTRHHISLLYAPLSINSKGTLNRELLFDKGSFPAGLPLKAVYRFNSYRVSYRYDFLRREKFEAGFGFTAKIRDAAILVKDNQTESEKTNVGFVPILHFRMLWNFHSKAGLLVEGDALAAPQGRAEDVLAALVWNASDPIDLKLGYRILEGGADNDEVYNFALIHYLSLGATFTF